ncbi:undecaprenyl-diphosphatase UppP [Candidatus Dojkabacteria bacterium]|nr:undecaprenyl-diphosphatase UppP [Candidatus Dojkabacteria bacterium]
MTLLQSLVLGIIQGITELLPISSSAHLVLVPEILGWELQPTSFDITVHAATLLALIINFRKDLIELVTKIKEQKQKRLFVNLLVVTIPACLAGLLLNNLIDEYFKSVRIIVFTLIFIGLIMLLIDKLLRNNSKTIDNLTVQNSITIGIGQTIALIRGISRSGITIIGGMICGLKREEAAKFAFLAGIPIMIAVSAKQFLDFGTQGLGELEPLNLIVAFVSALLSSLVAIKFLLAFLKKQGIWVFGIYRIILGILVWLLIL